MWCCNIVGGNGISSGREESPAPRMNSQKRQSQSQPDNGASGGTQVLKRVPPFDSVRWWGPTRREVPSRSESGVKILLHPGGSSNADKGQAFCLLTRDPERPWSHHPNSNILANHGPSNADHSRVFNHSLNEPNDTISSKTPAYEGRIIGQIAHTTGHLPLDAAAVAAVRP